jgi:hypothetical protein
MDPRVGLDDLEKRKFLALTEIELQPVASRYTDYAIPAPYTITYSNESGTNNVALYADTPSPVVLRLSKSEYLGNARFESELGHWLCCITVHNRRCENLKS